MYHTLIIYFRKYISPRPIIHYNVICMMLWFRPDWCPDLPTWGTQYLKDPSALPSSWFTEILYIFYIYWYSCKYVYEIYLEKNVIIVIIDMYILYYFVLLLIELSYSLTNDTLVTLFSFGQLCPIIGWDLYWYHT